MVPEETAEAPVVAAWETGVRHFDTAPHYGNGLSEHRFVTILRRYPREEFTLSTKVGRILRPDPSVRDNPPFLQCLPFGSDYDYSYDGTMRSIEDSYQRLGLAWRRSTSSTFTIWQPIIMATPGRNSSR